MAKTAKKMNLKCVSLIGDLSDLGKHIYLAETGVTICGCFTVDYDKEMFKGMPEGVTSEYKIEEWDITCERCLDMVDMFEGINTERKKQNN